MLDTITAITTSITAVVSVWIAYNSHKTTIKDKKLEKEERSQKVIRLFQRENERFRNIISILPKRNYDEFIESLSFETKELSIYERIKNYNIVEMSKTYREKADETLKNNLNHLTYEDEKKLVNLTAYITDLLFYLDILEMLIQDEEGINTDILETEENISIIANKIIKEV